MRKIRILGITKTYLYGYCDYTLGVMKKSIVEVPLKDVIIELLGKEGMSINGLSKVLEKKGIKVHRLFLTGYLVAMKDFGILKEREIKPAKVFSVQPVTKKDIYQIIGEKSRRIDEDEASDICLYSLYRMFNRPIFLRELNRAGVGSPRYGKKIVGEERKKALELLANAGITVPRNNSAYIPAKEYEDEFNQIIIELLIEEYSIKNLVSKSVQQKRIDEE